MRRPSDAVALSRGLGLRDRVALLLLLVAVALIGVAVVDLGRTEEHALLFMVASTCAFY